MARSRKPGKSEPRIVGRVSLKQLADHLGLSSTTVSRVMNESPGSMRISPETQRKVREAARLLNYTPNELARGLRSKRSHIVSVIVPEISDGYSTTVLSGIEDGLLLGGFFYFVVSHRHRPELLRQYPSLLLSRAVEGIIAVDTAIEEDLPIPVVSISGHARRRPSVVQIELDHVLAAHYALEHLYRLGHREIAFIRGQSFSSDTLPRWRAIQKVAAELGIRINPRLVVQLEDNGIGPEAGQLAAVKLLERHVPFTAIFCFNDISAVGAIRALRESGLRVPQQVSVVGFDDITSAATNDPPLTTVRQPLQDMGRAAATALLQMLRSESGAPPKSPIRVLPTFVERQSTAPALSARKNSEQVFLLKSR